MISDFIIQLLKVVMEKKLSPTFTARWLFIFTQLVHDGFQYVTGGGRQMDLFPKTNDRYSVSDIQTWMNMVCDLAFTLITNYIGNVTTPKPSLSYSPIFIETETWIKWRARAVKYFDDRNLDGWKSASVLVGTTPNQGIYIDTDASGLPLLNDNDSWTALKVQGSNKAYLTPEWGSVKGVIEDNEFTRLIDLADRYYPTTENWEKESKDVLEMSKTLTDRQKMIAEFWAGGPGSVTPPGFWFVFSYGICKSNNLTMADEVKLYTMLGLGVFQSSICAWKLKRNHLQARPIQRIRYLYDPEQSDWLPYQESNFVTPPFPDFVSGHSTFSACSSRIIYQIVKKNAIDLKGVVLNSDLLKLLNPVIFVETDNVQINLCQINILPGSSGIDTKTTTPLSGCSLEWSSLDQMADEAGLSRLYGGIHYESSNQGGLSLGRELANVLCNKYRNILDFVGSREPIIGGTKFYKK